MQLTEIRIAGFGGQGVILSAMIVGKAASIFEGGYATLTQSFGPEARGGASSAQVILSDAPILYPYVTQPDVLVVEEDLVRITGVRNGARVFGVPATRIAEELGRRMVLNVVMVGFFAAVTGLLSAESLRKAVADSVPPATRELNLRAFDRGYEYGLAKAPTVFEEGELAPSLESED